MRLNEPLPLTLEEHRELAGELRRVRARMNELRGLVTHVYGPNNRAAIGFSKTTDALEHLCADMEEQLAQDVGYPMDGVYT